MKIFSVLVKNIAIMVLSCPILMSCGTSGTKQVSDTPKEFKMISIPAILTTAEQRAEYLANNYWNNFDFTDTGYIGLPEVTEQAFADYLNVLPHASFGTAVKSMHSMLKKAEQDSLMFSYFAGQYEKYLYDPNSPMRNEVYYIPALEYILKSDIYDPTLKARQERILEMLYKNRVGEPAADFKYTLASGAQGNLYSVKSEYTVILFNNPDCNTCADIIKHMKASEIFTGLERSGRLKVLAVYPEKDLKAWKDNLSKMPSSWINSYDKGQDIENSRLYDLKAIPSLYLLNSDKTVLLKDAGVEVIEAYLYNHTLKAN